MTIETITPEDVERSRQHARELMAQLKAQGIQVRIRADGQGFHYSPPGLISPDTFLMIRSLEAELSFAASYGVVVESAEELKSEYPQLVN